MKSNKKQNFKEYLKKIEDPTYQREVNKDLPNNPTSLQVAKLKICQEILAYQIDHNLTDEEIAKKINLSLAETQDILFCWIEKFTLDRLVDYASCLFAPVKVDFIMRQKTNLSFHSRQKVAKGKIFHASVT